MSTWKSPIKTNCSPFFTDVSGDHTVDKIGKTRPGSDWSGRWAVYAPWNGSFLASGKLDKQCFGCIILKTVIVLRIETKLHTRKRKRISKVYGNPSSMAISVLSNKEVTLDAKLTVCHCRTEHGLCYAQNIKLFLRDRISNIAYFAPKSTNIHCTNLNWFNFVSRVTTVLFPCTKYSPIKIDQSVSRDQKKCSSCPVYAFESSHLSFNL